MPAALKLDLFADQLYSFFGDFPYLVGSALKTTAWRDVDVRVILPDDQYAALFPGCTPDGEHQCAKWCALCLAFAALGREMTGLPIDFQVQQQSWANKRHPGQRSALGFVEHRFKKD